MKGKISENWTIRGREAGVILQRNRYLPAWSLVRDRV